MTISVITKGPRPSILNNQLAYLHVYMSAIYTSRALLANGVLSHTSSSHSFLSGALCGDSVWAGFTCILWLIAEPPPLAGEPEAAAGGRGRPPR
jgi:hypothetical protein